MEAFPDIYFDNLEKDNTIWSAKKNPPLGGGGLKELFFCGFPKRSIIKNTVFSFFPKPTCKFIIAIFEFLQVGPCNFSLCYKLL